MTVTELQKYGLEAMDDEEIDAFLTNQNHGVLGLPTDGAPYLLPMAFAFDGDSSLYFAFFVGEESEKVRLADQADEAAFLVYSPDSVFYWESVKMRGSISRPTESEISDGALDGSTWKLDIFEQADTAGETVVYRFEIEDRTGFKSTGVPPGMKDKRENEN